MCVAHNLLAIDRGTPPHPSFCSLRHLILLYPVFIPSPLSCGATFVISALSDNLTHLVYLQCPCLFLYSQSFVSFCSVFVCVFFRKSHTSTPSRKTEPIIHVIALTKIKLIQLNLMLHVELRILLLYLCTFRSKVRLNTNIRTYIHVFCHTHMNTVEPRDKRRSVLRTQYKNKDTIQKHT